MDLKSLSEEELNILQDKYIDEYNKITAPYRAIFLKIDNEKTARYNRKINSCNHIWEKESDCYHNDKYYFCTKCGKEK